jgi:hypothetical protein
MTVDVVDALEAVEIEERHGEGHRLQLGREDGLVQFCQKTPAVGQHGQSVGIGETMVLVAEALHLLLPIQQNFA